MADRRRYTGTQMLQAIWTVVALVIGLLVQLLQPVVGGLLQPTVFLSVSGAWILGLVVIALYDRRTWNEMVEGSSFHPDTSTRLADLESLRGGRSVIVQTQIPDMFSQAHMEISTPVEGVDASFTVKLRAVSDGDESEGLQTGNDALDNAFVIRGNEANVSRVLSPEIQAKLLDIDIAGTLTITGNRVRFSVPFTRLSPGELDQLADLVLAIARHVESVAST